MSNEQLIPVIDLAGWRAGDPAARRETAGALDEACRETGFFTITGHGVEPALIAATRQAAVDFFALPEAEKRKVQRPPQKISRGWNPIGDRSLSYSLGKAAPADAQEAFALGPDDPPPGGWRTDDPRSAMFAPNLWPQRPEAFRTHMLAWYAAMETLGATLLRVMATALHQPEDWFADKHDRAANVMRLIRYPAQTAPPAPGQLRAGEHTDYGSVTIVCGDAVPGGLQVRHRKAGWIDVEAPPGGFVCNIADAMARWTNDRWVSTLHRVGNPPPQAEPRDRISLVFFHSPNADAEIRCVSGCEGPDGPKYPPVTFADHYLGKVMKAGHARADAGIADATADRD